jgi:hypothetical protein
VEERRRDRRHGVVPRPDRPLRRAAGRRAPVEEWQKYVRRAGSAEGFSARAFFKRELRAAIEALHANPRANPARVAAAFSLDGCVAKFFGLSTGLDETGPTASGRGSRPTPPSRPPAGAEEHWLLTDDPPLKGQLDRIRDGGIVDFKTGEPGPGHTDQLHFYATLWWVKFGTAPTLLQLRYPNEVVHIPVPTPGELQSFASSIAREIEEARIAITAGPPPARPDAERCRYCPVRQFCDDFWVSDATRPLRASPETGDGSPAGVFRDVQVTSMPDGWKPGSACAGACQADGLGGVSLKLAAPLCPSSSSPKSVAARVLQARVVADGKGAMSVTSTQATEVFWVPNPSS